jgi:molecular chaperone GrpE
LTDNQSAAGKAAGDQAAATEPSHSVDEPDRNDQRQSEDGAPINELDALKAEAQENWNKYLRSVAELENLRKRNARDVENARNYGIERLVDAILPVRDSLEAALKAATEVNEDAIEIGTLIEGDRATLRLLDQALDGAGIAEINPEGEPFDPQCHEAISLLPSASAEPNSVITVVQKGFSLHGRVVRPARVVVAQAPLGNDET